MKCREKWRELLGIFTTFAASKKKPLAGVIGRYGECANRIASAGVSLAQGWL
jgi:hypothetical protein